MHKNKFSHLHRFLDKNDFDSLSTLLQKRENEYEQNPNYLLKKKVSQRSFHKRAIHKDYSQDVIIIGKRSEIDDEEHNQLEKELTMFIPWRKGPFSLFDIFIDAEWQSYQKWNRILPYLNKMEGKIICDIGCNNGYYLYKIVHHKPEFVLGIDPTYIFKLTFNYLQKFSQEESLQYELMGFRELTFFRQAFDIIFCMGILYHHKNPLDILEICKHALKPNGTFVLESISIPGNESIALFPEGRYANMKGVWFVPTHVCIKNWLKKIGYASIHLASHQEMSEAEQRTTQWAPYPSFGEALDSQDKNITKEGYPRAYRSIYIATKK